MAIREIGWRAAGNLATVSSTRLPCLEATEPRHYAPRRTLALSSGPTARRWLHTAALRISCMSLKIASVPLLTQPDQRAEQPRSEEEDSMSTRYAMSAQMKTESLDRFGLFGDLAAWEGFA